MPDRTMVPMHIRELKMESLVSSLVLEDERGERFLPVRLGGPSAKAMHAELAAGPAPAGSVQDLLANTLSYMNGRVARIELRWEDRPGLLATIVIDQEGKEVRLPARAVDALALAHRYGAPIHTETFVLDRQGIRAGETGAKAAGADWMEAFRLTCGFKGLGRVDDAILACRRLRELDSPNRSWCETLGNLYRQKGWLAAAARELTDAMAWYESEGYLGMTVDIARDLASIDFSSLPCRAVVAPAVLEDFATVEFNNEWLGAGGVVDAPDGQPGRAYRLGSGRTWFILGFLGTQTWKGARTILVDVHVGPQLEPTPPMALGMSLTGQREGFYSSEDAVLRPGWNHLEFALADPRWQAGERKGLRLDDPIVGPVVNVQFLFGKGRPAGNICFADLRLT